MKSLVGRLFLLTAALVALPIVAAVMINAVAGRAAGESTVQSVLSSSQTVQQSFARQRALQLELVSQLFASDPAFVGYVAQATTAALPGMEVDVTSVADLLRERQQQFGFDFALLLDPTGNELARADGSMSVRRDFGDQPLVADALESFRPGSGYWTENDTLYQAAVIPLARGGNLLGFLITGLRVDAELAAEIAAASGAEVAFVRIEGETLEILASTLDAEDNAAMAATLGADAATGDEAEIQLGGERWIYRLSPVGGGGASPGAIVSLVSLDSVLAPQLRARNYLLIAGAVALALALLATPLLTRRALQPIASLSSAIDRVLAGDYRQRIETHGVRELEGLGKSFNRLVVDLRRENALDRHLTDLFKSSKGPGEKIGDAADAVSIGTVFLDRFEIIRSLGVGGMGIVYKAMDRELKEIVVLKMLRPEIAGDEANVERLRDEIRVARKIAHPNVVRTYDISHVGAQHFLSMEYVEGYTLRHLLDRFGRLDVDAAMRVLDQVCRGLEAAHEASVIHRDLKPDNIMVQFDATAKLMDFGIARPSTGKLTDRSDELVEGTGPYLSPEQIQGQVADARSDIYALGVIMMELLTGNLPHIGATPYDTMVSHLRNAPRPPSQFWPQIAKDLETIVLRCLEKQAGDRYSDVRELRLALDSARL